MARQQILLVGEAPGRQARHKKPLAGSSMRAIVRAAGLPFPHAPDLIRAIGVRLYAETFARVNVVEHFPGSVWPADVAASRAKMLWCVQREKCFIILGLRAARAFGLEALALFERFDAKRHIVYRMPHPSGRNRWWNDLGNRERARTFLFPFFVPAIRRASRRLRAAGAKKQAQFYARLLSKKKSASS